MDLFKYLLLVILASTLVSCGPKIVFEETIKFEGETWSYDDSLNFDFVIQDTLSKYDLLVDITHNANYPYQNVYGNIATVYPDGTSLDQLLSFEMAEKSGRWYGKCDDEFCRLTIPLQTALRFDQLGDYRISFEQFSRKEKLWGFNSFTLRLTESIIE